MEKKFAKLGTMLSRAQAKKMVGGQSFTPECSEVCETDNFCSGNAGCPKCIKNKCAAPPPEES